MISSVKRFPIIAAVITLAVIVGGVFLFSRGSKTPEIPQLSGYEYYWGNGCPHCAKVEEFMSTWEGKDKIALDKREVWYDKSNAALMASRADSCGIARSNLAVPLLVTPDGKCIEGDEPIIQFFKELDLSK